MDKTKQKFEIIYFTADGRPYYPTSMKHESWMPIPAQTQSPKLLVRRL